VSATWQSFSSNPSVPDSLLFCIHASSCLQKNAQVSSQRQSHNTSDSLDPQTCYEVLAGQSLLPSRTVPPVDRFTVRINMRIPWNKESYIPGAGVYAFSQEAAEAWAWAFDRDDDAQMKPSISRGLGQDLVKHPSLRTTRAMPKLSSSLWGVAPRLGAQAYQVCI